VEQKKRRNVKKTTKPKEQKEKKKRWKNKRGNRREREKDMKLGSVRRSIKKGFLKAIFWYVF